MTTSWDREMKWLTCCGKNVRWTLHGKCGSCMPCGLNQLNQWAYSCATFPLPLSTLQCSSEQVDTTGILISLTRDFVFSSGKETLYSSARDTREYFNIFVSLVSTTARLSSIVKLAVGLEHTSLHLTANLGEESYFPTTLPKREL